MPSKPKRTKGQKGQKPPPKVRVVMREFGSGRLHSGSPKGRIVTDPDQAYAIGWSEHRKQQRRQPRRGA